MPRYRVTVNRPAIETIEAANPYMAAAAVIERSGEGAIVTDVRPATGRAAGRTNATKTTAKKRKPLSPAARARLAEKLKTARAARARKLKATKKTAKKTTAKTAKRATRKR
jgi:hypothetical protein